MIARLAPVMFLLALNGAVGLAQGTARDSAVAQAVSTLTLDSRLRVGLLREQWTGRFRGAVGDTLFLGAVGGPPMAIRFNAVDTLWVGVPATRRGAMIGGLLGAGLGVAAMAAFGDFSDAAPTLAVSVGGGVLAGALLGSMGSRWKRTYPPPD